MAQQTYAKAFLSVDLGAIAKQRTRDKVARDVSTKLWVLSGTVLVGRPPRGRGLMYLL